MSLKVDHLGMPILAVAVLLGGITVANRNSAGFYHDDAIYLTTGRAIADGRGIVLDGVPGHPHATKYPPLYPLLLAGVWSVADTFPANLSLLKGVNASLLAGTILLLSIWLRRTTDLTWGEQLAVATLTATAPGFFSFADVLLAEPLFLMFTVATLAVFPVERRDSTRTLLAALFAVLATLTRLAGISIVVATLWAAVRRRHRYAPEATLISAVGCSAWSLWAASQAVPTNDLLQYYVRYETSAWFTVVAEPEMAWRIVSANVIQLFGQAPRVWGLGSGYTLFITVPVTGLGAYLLLRDQRQPLVGILSAAYLGLVIAHPFPFARYIAPLTPLAMTFLVVGARHLRQKSGMVAVLPLILVGAFHAAWVAHFVEVARSGSHGEFGRELGFSTTGFSATADWIRQHTPATAVLASPHDQWYSLHTGRIGVRPWYHAIRPLVVEVPKSGGWLLARLEEAGVSYLIVDPVTDSPEGAYARNSIQAILNAGGDRWVLVYDDRRFGHAIYRLVPE